MGVGHNSVSQIVHTQRKISLSKRWREVFLQPTARNRLTHKKMKWKLEVEMPMYTPGRGDGNHMQTNERDLEYGLASQPSEGDNSSQLTNSYTSRWDRTTSNGFLSMWLPTPWEPSRTRSSGVTRREGRHLSTLNAECPPMGFCVCIFGPQLAVLFGEVVGPLGGET